VRGFLNGKAQYREKGRTRKTSRLELAIKRHVTAALNGDVGSAAMLLKMRAHGMKFGDVGLLIIRLINPPDLVSQCRAQEEERLADSSGESLPHKASSSAVERMLSGLPGSDSAFLTSVGYHCPAAFLDEPHPDRHEGPATVTEGHRWQGCGRGAT
jgi:hypothetical protein